MRHPERSEGSPEIGTIVLNWRSFAQKRALDDGHLLIRRVCSQPNPIWLDGDLPLLVEIANGILKRFFTFTQRSLNLLRTAFIMQG